METTIENNKIIAEFMGLKPKRESPEVYTYSDMPYFSSRENDPEKVMQSIAEYAKYHSSWDWLMPVVEKIESMSFQTFIALCDDGSHRFKISKGDDHYDVFGVPVWASTKIEAVYNGCIRFIKALSQLINQLEVEINKL